MRREAVHLARNGHVEEALTRLRKLHIMWPDDKGVTSDLIVISGWAGLFREAGTLFEQEKASDFPDYVLLNMINVYRHDGDAQKALVLINHLMQSRKADSSLQLKKALILIDLGHLDEAEHILAGLAESFSKSADFHNASAYLHEKQQRPLAQLNDYINALTLLPDNQQLRRDSMLLLDRLKAPTLALRYNRQTSPSVLTKSQLARLLTGKAAELLRWGTDVEEEFAKKQLFALQALALQLEALSLLDRATGDEGQRRQIYLDMLISLRNIGSMEELQALYAILAARGVMPPYTQQALADSFLATKNPDRARKIYKDLVTENPGNFQAAIGLFYALVEEEDFAGAFKVIDSLAKHEPKFIYFRDSKSGYPNERFLDYQVISLQARFYADQLAESWQGLNKLVLGAPANSWLREVRGGVSNARDWPRQALDDFQIASLLSPDSLDAKVGKGESLIQLHLLSEARQIVEDTALHYPREHSTQMLMKSWEDVHEPAYWLDTVFSNSSGPDLDGDGIVAGADVISSPVYDNWYFLAGYRYAWNELTEGEETYQRTILGVEYLRGNLDIMSGVTANDSTRTEVGAIARLSWQPDDFWQFTLAGELFSVLTPLRALYHDIKSDRLEVNILYRQSEQMDISTSMAVASFTDDNTRVEGNAIFRRRMIDIPHLDVDGRIEVYGSTNSKSNVPYYNPEYDGSLQAAVHADHVYHRYYDHLFAQQIDVGIGVYGQKGFSTSWIGHIRYEQRYQFARHCEVLAGIEFGKNVYDGEDDNYRLFTLKLSGKF